MKNHIYQQLITARAQQKKSFAVLIDPDKTESRDLENLILLGKKAKVDYWFVGGSLVVSNHLEQLVVDLKTKSDIPVILFPGSPSQVTPKADALLYLRWRRTHYRFIYQQCGSNSR